MSYNQWYEWKARPDLPERIKKIVRETLRRIPPDDLAELQQRKVVIDCQMLEAQFFGLTSCGLAGRVTCAISDEPGMSDAALIGVLAHELAHARLGHTDLLIAKNLPAEEYQATEARLEAAANRCVFRWGFDLEWQEFITFVKRRDRLIAEAGKLLG
jgi:hypothetical protein